MQDAAFFDHNNVVSKLHQTNFWLCVVLKPYQPCMQQLVRQRLTATHSTHTGWHEGS